MQGVNWDTVQSDHPDDRSIFPNHFLNFAQTGRLGRGDGNGAAETFYTTQLPTFEWEDLHDYFAADYRTWLPGLVDPIPLGSAAGDVADTMGSSSNPTVMQNLAGNLNLLKGRVYTTEGNPVGDATWDAWMVETTLTMARATEMITALRGTFAMFDYLRQIAGVRDDVFAARRAALDQFDHYYAIVSIHVI